MVFKRYDKNDICNVRINKVKNYVIFEYDKDKITKLLSNLYPPPQIYLGLKTSIMTEVIIINEANNKNGS